MKSQLTCKCIFGSIAFFSQIAGVAFETIQYKNNIHNVDVNEQVSIVDGFTVLNLGPSANHGSSVSDLTKKIALMNADVVCISEVYDANTFYEALQKSYAHFLYMDSSASASVTSDQSLMGGFLIASKYPLEAAQFSKLSKDANNSNEGLIDFVIRNSQASIGHIYATNLKNDESIEIQTSAFIAIIEKMQKDFLNTDGTSPFFLCGDFSALQDYEESKIFVDTYFVLDRNYATEAQALLLETSNLLPSGMNWSHTLSTTKIMDGVRSGLRAVVRRQNQVNDSRRKNEIENDTLLCAGKGKAEASVKGDTEGNVSVGGSLSYSYESENGNKYSGEVSGGASRDSEGNYSGRAEARAGIDFNQ